MQNQNIETQTAALVSAPIFGDLKGAIAFCDAAHAAETAAAAPIDAPDVTGGLGISAAQIELLQECNDAPAIKRAALMLLEFATSEAIYLAGEGDENPIYGRFCFTDYSQTSAEIRAALAILRRSLDFLEVDFLACETETVNHLRGEVANFDAMRAV